MSALQDVADSPRASMCDHPADHLLEAMCPSCGHPVDACCPVCHGNVEQSGAIEKSGGRNPKAEVQSCLTPADFYRRFVLLIQNARNSKFLLGCYLIATGDGFADGVSMTDYARHWGVRKATVSKQCRLICAYLGIKPSRYMRKEEVAERFRLSNRRPRRLGNPKAEIRRPKEGRKPKSE
jgi:hypothetical protein